MRKWPLVIDHLEFPLRLISFSSTPPDQWRSERWARQGCMIGMRDGFGEPLTRLRGRRVGGCVCGGASFLSGAKRVMNTSSFVREKQASGRSAGRSTRYHCLRTADEDPGSCLLPNHAMEIMEFAMMPFFPRLPPAQRLLGNDVRDHCVIVYQGDTDGGPMDETWIFIPGRSTVVED